MPGMLQLFCELDMAYPPQQHKVTSICALAPQQECINNWVKLIHSALAPRDEVEVENRIW